MKISLVIIMLVLMGLSAEAAAKSRVMSQQRSCAQVRMENKVLRRKLARARAAVKSLTPKPQPVEKGHIIRSVDDPDDRYPPVLILSVD